MAFQSSVARVLPKFGTPTVTASSLNVNTNTNIVLPAAATNFSIPVTAGYIRVKSVTPGVNATMIVKAITGWDSTNSTNIWQINPGDTTATSNGAAFDQMYAFCTDVAFSRINVVVTAGNNVSQVDVELAANP